MKFQDPLDFARTWEAAYFKISKNNAAGNDKSGGRRSSIEMDNGPGDRKQSRASHVGWSDVLDRHMQGRPEWRAG